MTGLSLSHAQPHPVLWQHLKTGFSERTLVKQHQASNSSSSLGFAIDCLNSSYPKGNLLFIDLRNRTVQRIKVQEEKKEESKNDLHADVKRKAKESIAAEMAQLNKRWWQCHCLSGFVNQCWKRLMRLSPRTAQLRFLRESTKKQLKGTERVTDQDEIQLDDTKKTFREKRTTTEEKAHKNTGEERIQEAKIVWLKDCKRIMHAREKMEVFDKEKVLSTCFGYFTKRSGPLKKLDNNSEELLREHSLALASTFRAYATAEDDSTESNSDSSPLLLTSDGFSKMLQDCRLMSERGAQVTSRHVESVWKQLPTAVPTKQSLDMSRFLEVIVLLSRVTATNATPADIDDTTTLSASGERLQALLRPLLAHARRDAAGRLARGLIHDDGAKACDTLDVCTTSFFREVRSIRSIPSCGIAIRPACVCV